MEALLLERCVQKVIEVKKIVVRLEEEWKEAQNQGVGFLTEIGNGLMKITYTNDPVNWGDLMDVKELHEEVSMKLMHTAISKYQSLMAIIDRLATNVQERRQICIDLDEFIQELLLGHQDNTIWVESHKIQSIASYFREITEMYEKEVFSKSLITADVLNCTNRNKSLVYITSWQTQPYIDDLRITEIFSYLEMITKK